MFGRERNNIARNNNQKEMEASTTIRGMIQGNTIFVPDYQRAYSWETDLEGKKRKQVNVFLEDLEDYLTSLSSVGD